MEATSTETTRFCPMCAAPMRPRASFCHRCGNPFPDESAVVYKSNNSSPETHQLKAREETETNHHENQSPAAALAEADDFNKTVAALESAPGEPETVLKNPEKPQIKKRRRITQTTEYVWEESNSDPTWLFALVTVIIAVFVILMLWLGRFIRF